MTPRLEPSILPDDTAADHWRGRDVARRLGKVLSAHNGTWVEDLRVTKVGEDRNKVARWRVDAYHGAGFAGFAGLVSGERGNQTHPISSSSAEPPGGFNPANPANPALSHTDISGTARHSDTAQNTEEQR